MSHFPRFFALLGLAVLGLCLGAGAAQAQSLSVDLGSGGSATGRIVEILPDGDLRPGL